MIKNIDTPFKKSLVLVCSTCSRQFSEDLTNSSERIKSELKIMAKEHFGREVRVVNSTCLGLCPANAVAITRVSLDQGGVTCFEVAPSVESSPLFDKLFKEPV